MVKIGKMALIIVPFMIGAVVGAFVTAAKDGFEWGLTDFYNINRR